MAISWQTKAEVGAAAATETTTTSTKGTTGITTGAIATVVRRATEGIPMIVIMVTLMFTGIMSITTRGIGGPGTTGKNTGADIGRDSITEDITGTTGISSSDFVIQAAVPAFSFQSGDKAQQKPRSY